jgi:hypothetical protein
VTSLISPSKITGWLECAHTLTLHHRVESKQLKVERGPLGDMAKMLMAKGQSHELEVLARYEEDGRSIFYVPKRITPENPAPADGNGRTTDDVPAGPRIASAVRAVALTTQRCHGRTAANASSGMHTAAS